MHNNKLTQTNIGFALHGYENDILSWLELIVNFYETNLYPLKSVSYDIDYNKEQTKSLKTFYRTIKEDKNYPIDKLYSFTVFSGESQRYPDTWHYGCYFDKPSKGLIMFFDSSYEEEQILQFYKNFLQALLKGKVVWTGYLFYEERHFAYPLGGIFLTQNFYKEDGEIWKKFAHRLNIAETLQKKDMYRHIYKQNILSKRHLEEKFDKMLLTEWVDKNNYGVIEKIGTENWLWTVPEKKLREVQMIFYNKKLLLGVE